MTQHRSAAQQLFVGKSEMAIRMRSLDWSLSALGSVETWPQSLRSALSICLNSRFPIAIYWGADCLLLYNDAWRPIVGDKHPWALGRPAREVWSEIWDDIGLELASVLATGEGTFHNDELLSMHRFGYTEECFFEYTFNPIQGQGGVIGGVFNIVSETTYRVLNDRRARLLREVASRTGTAKTAQEACALMVEAFRSAPADIPFALLYLIDPDGRQARLCGSTEFASDSPVSPAVIDLTAADDADGWSIALAARTAQSQVVDDLVSRFGELPGSPWPEPPQEAMVLPIAATGQGEVTGVLVAAASPRRRLDDNYRDFFGQVVGQMALAIANAQAYEAERKRAEALAELDRAKTAFFSNVSHEFRTPLTLMLSPMEELSNSLDDRLQPDEREQLQLMQRNGLRLQKLVNTLLDFSRIEAGRVQASYEATDLATYTAELASVFRSLIEQAGMNLVIDCSPLPEPVYVDRDMWEKIVLNLISNAFKFTFEGSITVRLEVVDNQVELSVKDTGVGIPEAEVPQLFERFHRVSGTRSRTYEGSGIGLALVQELVKLHGGTIQVTSQLERGTTFAIAIPFGTAHLPSERLRRGEAERIEATRTLASTALGANPYVAEASRWLPAFGSVELGGLNVELEEDEARSVSSIQNGLRPATLTKLKTQNSKLAYILLADDNADMRDYVKRLLSQYFEVEAVSDGQDALDASQKRPPDLVLSDVMMPRLDGFGLVRELRNDPRTREIPIILLSARAGEESRVEGLEAGADDYLTKPFSARELLARVEATLKLAQLRKAAAQTLQQSEDRYRAFIQQSSEGIWRFEVEPSISIDCSEDEQIQHFYQHAYLAECNQVMAQMYGASTPQDLLEAKLTDFLVPSDPRNLEYLRAFIRSGYRLTDAESYEVDRQGNPKIFLNNLIGIVEDGKLVRAWGTQRDITDRKQAEVALRESEERLKLSVEGGRMVAWEWNPFQNTIVTTSNLSEIYGIANIQTAEQGFALVHPEDRSRHQMTVENAVATGSNYQSEFRFIRPDNGAIIWLEERGKAVLNGDGSLQKLIGVTIDISDRKQAEAAHRESENRLRTVAANLPNGAAFIVDCELRYQLAEGKALEEAGMTSEDLVGKTIWEALDPSLAAIYEPYFRQALNGESFSWEHHSHDRDYISHGTPLYNNQGEVEAVLVVSYDITDRKQAEIALQESEQRYRSLVMATSSIVWVAAGNGEILSAPAWEAFTGQTPEQYMGWGWFEMVHPDDRETTIRGWTHGIENKIPCEVEHRLMHRDGQYRHTVARAVPILDDVGNVREWVGTVTDITDRKRAEADLRESEARYRLLAEAIPQFVWMTDADGQNEYVNQRFCDYTGLTAEQMRGSNWLSILHPDDLEMTCDCWLTAVNSGQFYEIEYRFRGTDGSYRWFLGQGIPLKDEQGQIYKWFGTCTDIEPQKQIEQTRLRLLEQEQTAREQAETANRIKDEFLAVLSHELRSPLNPILGWSRLLQNGKLDENRAKQALSTIERNAKLQSELIEDLLDVSRILQGKLSLTVSPINLASTIKAAIETVRLAAQAKSIRIEANLDAEVGQVSGDSTRLQQVVWNLLSNAVKFTPNGGRVEVKLSLVIGHSSFAEDGKPKTNDQGQKTHDKFAQITVSDTGKGISPDFLPYVFDYFRQADSATTRKFGGLGLGLAIVRHLVELHGGTIQADSPGEGLGATFTVKLPLMPTKPTVNQDSQLSQPALDLNGIQVLVVDDNTDTRDFIAFLLEQAGARVIAAACADEALTALTQSQPDVLISDIGMPQMDGYMLMRQIRALPPEQGGQIRAIALTAYAGDFNQQQALQAGFQQHLAKPIEPDQLVRAVATLSQLRQR